MKKISFFVLLMFLVAGCSSSKIDTEKTDALANCLADNDVKEYGAFWCANCAKQKKMFGSSFDIIMERNVYIECDPRGDNEQSAKCLEIGVERYPHWVFNNDIENPLIGVQELSVLAEKAGCPWSE